MIGNPISEHLTYLFLGCGTGAVIGSIAIGLVLTHRASGVLNLAHAAMGLYIAVAFYELRSTGELILPFLGLPDRLSIVSSPTVAPCEPILSLAISIKYMSKPNDATKALNGGEFLNGLTMKK